MFNISGNKRLTKYQFGIKIANKFEFKKTLLRKLYLKDTLEKSLDQKI